MAQVFSMMRILNTSPSTSSVGSGLLVLRVVVGGAFILYGQEKMFSPAGWLDAFGVHGIAPAFQLLAFLTELVGGAFLVVGFLTPVAAVLIAFDMLTAIVVFLVPHGATSWIDPTKPLTLEKNVFYIAAMLLFVSAGAGRFSIDALLQRRNT